MTQSSDTRGELVEVAFRQIIPWAAYCDPPLLESTKQHVRLGLHATVAREQLIADWATETEPAELGREWIVDTGEEDPANPGQTLVLHLPFAPADDPDRPPTLVCLGAAVQARRPQE